mgnify:CR=1 FL=1|jgi:hypothetical protein|tara:strand:+ start:107 stop:334 length:228 start_codon:yes stop_codon:yes gene_type:complete
MFREENKFIKGDLVRRVIATHYTNHVRSDAMGVVIRVHYPLARVFFYDTNKEEIWNQSVLELVSRKSTRNDDESR